VLRSHHLRVEYDFAYSTGVKSDIIRCGYLCTGGGQMKTEDGQ